MTTTTKAPALATEKQVAFLHKLLARRVGVPAVDLVAAAVATLAERGEAITRSQASIWIDGLLAIPVPAAVEVPEGFHLLGGEVRKVQRSQTGNLYAKVLLPALPGEKRGRWEYAGRDGLAGLSADTVLTVERAREHGLHTGWCAVCGAHLHDPKSVARGIGPVCAKNLGR